MKSAIAALVILSQIRTNLHGKSSDSDPLVFSNYQRESLLLSNYGDGIFINGLASQKMSTVSKGLLGSNVYQFEYSFMKWYSIPIETGPPKKMIQITDIYTNIKYPREKAGNMFNGICVVTYYVGVNSSHGNEDFINFEYRLDDVIEAGNSEPLSMEIKTSWSYILPNLTRYKVYSEGEQFNEDNETLENGPGAKYITFPEQPEKMKYITDAQFHVFTTLRTFRREYQLNTTIFHDHPDNYISVEEGEGIKVVEKNDSDKITINF